MKKILTILSLAICFITNAQSFQTRSSGVVTTIDVRGGARLNWYNAYSIADTTLNGGYDTLGAQLHVRSGALQGLWYRDSVPTGGHHWVRAFSSENLTNYWQLSSNNLSPISTSYNVGIGIATPLYRFDVYDGTSGHMAFQNGRLTLYDDVDLQNVKLGYGVGSSLSGNYNIGIANSAIANAVGNFNIGIGSESNYDISGSKNTSLGVLTSVASVGSDNTSLGYQANAQMYGINNVAIGSLSQNATSLFADSLSHNVVATSTSTFTGSEISSFITSAGLSIGQSYMFRMDWRNATVMPSPFNSNSNPTQIRRATVTNSSTITFHNFVTFSSQGSDSLYLTVYNKQDNAIAIGYGVESLNSNEISIGNLGNTLLTVNKFIVDIQDVPSNGEVLTWNAGAGKAQWDTVTTGGGSGISSVTLPLVFSGGNLSINNATTSTSGVVTPNASDFNLSGAALTIDYTNGQASDATHKGFLTSTDWNTFNGKISNITGYITAGTNVSLTGSGTSGSPYVINVSGGGTGSVTSVTGINANGFTWNITNPTTTPFLTIDLQNATTSLSGKLTSTDWNTFNNKQAAITGAATTITTSNLTASRAVISNASGKIDVSSVTSTELGYVSGATSNLQSQINTITDKAFNTLTDGATVTYDYSLGFNAQLTIGGNRNITITNMSDGDYATIFVTQDATGGRTLTFPAGTKLLDGIGTSPTVTLTATPNAIDILTVVKRGSVLYVTSGYFH